MPLVNCNSNAGAHRRHCVVSLSKNINPSLVLVQPRKTRPFKTERLLMGRKESNKLTNTMLVLFSADVRRRLYIKIGLSVCASVRRRFEWELCGRNFWALFLYHSDAHVAWKYRQFLFIYFFYFFFFTFEFLAFGYSVSATHRTVYRSF